MTTMKFFVLSDLGTAAEVLGHGLAHFREKRGERGAMRLVVPRYGNEQHILAVRRFDLVTSDDASAVG
jgi:hypothetical protein